MIEIFNINNVLFLAIKYTFLVTGSIIFLVILIELAILLYLKINK